MEQRSPEWHDARKGKLTSSNFAEAVGVSGSRKRLWRELTGRQDRRVNEYMTHGTDWEPYARRLYEAANNVTIEQIGFVNHLSIPWLGGSPDGFIDTNGILELKCPQKMYVLFPMQYMPQVQGLLHMSHREWCDLMAWVPPIEADDGTELAPAHVRTWRVYKSDTYWYALLAELTIFWGFIIADVEPPAYPRGGKPVFPVDDVRIDPPIDL